MGNGMGDSSRPFFHITYGNSRHLHRAAIKEGHFAVSYIEGDDEPVPFIVDPSIVSEPTRPCLTPRLSSTSRTT